MSPLCMAGITSLCIVQLLPNGVEDLIETSVELAVYLGRCSVMDWHSSITAICVFTVSHGALSPCSEVESTKVQYYWM